MNLSNPAEQNQSTQNLDPAAAPATSLSTLLAALTPIVGVTVHLRFRREVHPELFHEPALTGMLRTLMAGSWPEDALLWVNASETGRVSYAPDDTYRFTILAARPAHTLLQQLLQRLPELERHLRSEHKVPFSDAVEFTGLRHPVSGQALAAHSPAILFDADILAAERLHFAGSNPLRIRLLSPLRVLRDKQERGQTKGEARYVHDAAHLQSLFCRRLYNSLQALAKAQQLWLPRPAAEPLVQAADLFLVDWHYRNSDRAQKPMAGLLGWLDLNLQDQDPLWLDALLLTQRLGMGQRRSFGWGAIRLESQQGQGVVPPRFPLRNLLQRASTSSNLQAALSASLPAGDAAWEFAHHGKEQVLSPEQHRFLSALGSALQAGTYEPPPLQGQVLFSPDGRIRPLAIPPWQDRVLQRSLALLLTPALESIFSPESFGYRRGRSRFTLRDQLMLLYRHGYRYYFEADIHGFFDHVSWPRLDTRLRALFGDDPALPLLLRWMAAPVRYQDHLVQRERGLPQGSPLSPLLANLLLEDLDADCAANGFKLLRYADDFVILCRNEKEAQRAWARAETSIGEMGLRLKPGKTGIGMLDQGLDFLGFRFLGDLVVDKSAAARTPKTRCEIPEQSWLGALCQEQAEIARQVEEQWAAACKRRIVAKVSVSSHGGETVSNLSR